MHFPSDRARGIAEKATNAVLIKLNQIGTVAETISAIKICRTAGLGFIISHRSGETEGSYQGATRSPQIPRLRTFARVASIAHCVETALDQEPHRLGVGREFARREFLNKRRSSCQCKRSVAATKRC